MKYLPLYKKWMKTGRLPLAGLCCSLYWAENIYLFKPRNASHFSYWANNGADEHTFNPLRQNILLFLACMNDEY